MSDEQATGSTVISNTIVLPAQPGRRKLADERKGITHKFSVAGHEGYLNVGCYEDGTPGEIFLTMSKEGSTLSGFADSFATMVSLAFQYGVPVEKIVDKLKGVRFEPFGVALGCKEIENASSIMDYIGQYLELRFVKKINVVQTEVKP